MAKNTLNDNDVNVELRLINDTKNKNEFTLFQKQITNINKEVSSLNSSFSELSKNIANVAVTMNNMFKNGQVSLKQYSRVLEQLSSASNLTRGYSALSNRVEQASQVNLVKAMQQQALIKTRITNETIRGNLLERENRDYKIAQLNAQARINTSLANSRRYQEAYRKSVQATNALKEAQRQIEVDIQNRQNSLLKTTQRYNRAIQTNVTGLGQFRTATIEVNNYNTSLKKADDNTKKLSKSSNTLFTRLWRLTRSIAIARTLGNVVSQIVQESGTWIENLNLFAVTFGESEYREVLDWATDFADKFGVANNEIVEMLGLFKQLSTSFGITEEQGTQLSQTLAQLAYDLSSFYNIDVSTAEQKLQSGIFSGEIRPLRNLGIDVSEASINNLLSLNEQLRQFNLNMTDLTQSQKVIARTIVALQVSTNAFGDFARSIDTLQNRIRIFEASIANLRLALGDLVSEYARSFFGYAIAITQVITEIIRMISPLQEELTYDIGDTVFTEISDQAEDAATSINQLPFDKWQSLTSGDNEQLDVTETLNQLLQEQIEQYETISSQFDGIDEEVQNIKNSLLGWVFPNTTIDALNESLEGITDQNERFNIVLAQLNPVLQDIIKMFQSVFGILSQIFDIVKVFSPELTNIISILIKIVSTFIQIFDKLSLIYPLLVAIIALKFANSLATTISNLSKLGTAFKSMIAWFQNYNLQCQLATTRTQIFQQSIGAVSLGIFALVGAITSLIANWDNMNLGQKISTIAILAATVTAAATAFWALRGNWARALSVAGIVIAAGATVATVVSGFENGGIPEKSELFYMNERGVPEALVNTGGSQTNVINMNQLAEGMRRGFVQAIQDTGLNRQRDVSLTLSPNSDSSFARALFPALKQESRRRGGNQL